MQCGLKKNSLFSFFHQFEGIGRSRQSRDCSLFGGCNGSTSICKSKYLSQPWLILKIKMSTNVRYSNTRIAYYYQSKWRWMVYRIYLKHRVVVNNLAKESTNKWITSTCGINSVHMESLNWSMEILYFDNKIGEYLENQVHLWLNWIFFIHLTFVFTFDNYLWHKVWVSYETRQEHCSWVAGK